MWRRKKSPLETLQVHPGTANDFLRSVDQNLYRLGVEETAECSTLYLEQDPHLYAPGFDAYTLAARASWNGKDLEMPVLALRIMEGLLDGFAVFTHLRDLPVDPLVMAELSKYRVAPQCFVPSYVRFCQGHPSESERVFYDGKDAMLTLTNGMNRGLLEAFFMTPGFNQTILMMQTGCSQNVLKMPISDYAEAVQHSKEVDYRLSVNYYLNSIHINIQNELFSEQELLKKLRSVCSANGKALELLWPEFEDKVP